MIVFYLSAPLLLVAGFYQIKRLAKSRVSSDIVFSHVCVWVASIISLANSALNGIPSLILANSVSLMIAGVGLIMALSYRPKNFNFKIFAMKSTAKYDNYEFNVK